MSLMTADPSVDRAEALLQERGLEGEREPTWIIKGKKPDLFCTGEVSLWVEVKTLGGTPLEKTRDYLHEELRQRSSHVEGRAKAFSYVSERCEVRDVKVVMRLAEILLGEWERQGNPVREAYVMVPDDPMYAPEENVRLVAQRKDHPVLILSCGSRTGKYQFPLGVEPWSRERQASIDSLGVPPPTELLYELTGQEVPRIALHIAADPGLSRFEVQGPMLVGHDHRLRNAERLRECVKEANAQFRNGWKYRREPSLAFVYEGGILVPDDIIVLAALYGDLTCTFPQCKPASGHRHYGCNGVFRPEKYRAVSALCLIRNDGNPLTVHNYWAELPLPRGLVGGEELILTDAGAFERVDGAA